MNFEIPSIAIESPTNGLTFIFIFAISVVFGYLIYSLRQRDVQIQRQNLKHNEEMKKRDEENQEQSKKIAEQSFEIDSLRSKLDKQQAQIDTLLKIINIDPKLIQE